MATSSKKFSTFLGKNEHLSRSDLQIKEGLEAQPSEFQSPEGDALYGVSGQSGPGQSALAYTSTKLTKDKGFATPQTKLPEGVQYWVSHALRGLYSGLASMVRFTRSYRDSIGIITACTGHTGPELRMGQTFTRQQCQGMFYQDLVPHANALGCITQPLTDGQRAAFLSFAFNVGEGAFCRSTLVRKANAGDVHGACAELSRWTYAAGKQLPGLVQRRAAERQMCEGGLA